MSKFVVLGKKNKLKAYLNTTVINKYNFNKIEALINLCL